MAKKYDPILCMMVDEKVNTKDAADPIQQRKHEIVVKTENYLRSIGKSNSVGKFDRVVQGVKNLLYQGFLEGPELERAIKQEADRLIKKYNLDECPESMKDASPIPVAKVIETKGKYSIIQDDRGLYWVTIDKTGHGGGTVEVNLSDARRTLEHYMLMDKLEAKYGKKEGYKRYLAGETDECPEGMTCDKRSIDKAIRICDAVEVETSRWSFSSGKSKPSGLGNWWFKIGTEEKNFYGNWSNAKAEAIKYAKEKGINRISLMT